MIISSIGGERTFYFPEWCLQVSPLGAIQSQQTPQVRQDSLYEACEVKPGDSEGHINIFIRSSLIWKLLRDFSWEINIKNKNGG